MKIRTPRLAGLYLLLATSVAAWASEPGNMMKMTTTVHMQMAGMPAMPATTHTREVCGPVKLPDPQELMPQRKECAISNVQHSSDGVSFHMECSGAMSMRGDGKYRTSSNGDVHGSFHMTGSQGERTISADTQIDGERMGACDYTPPASG